MQEFLMAVEGKDPHFTLTYMMKLEDREIDDIYDDLNIKKLHVLLQCRRSLNSTLCLDAETTIYASKR